MSEADQVQTLVPVLLAGLVLGAYVREKLETEIYSLIPLPRAVF